MTVGGAGFALFDTLTRFAQTIQSAERDVGLVARDIRYTVAVLELIRANLQETEASQSLIIQKVLDILPGLTRDYITCFSSIQGLIAYLKPHQDPAVVRSSKCNVLSYAQASSRRFWRSGNGDKRNRRLISFAAILNRSVVAISC